VQYIIQWNSSSVSSLDQWIFSWKVAHHVLPILDLTSSINNSWTPKSRRLNAWNDPIELSWAPQDRDPVAAVVSGQDWGVVFHHLRRPFYGHFSRLAKLKQRPIELRTESELYLSASGRPSVSVDLTLTSPRHSCSVAKTDDSDWTSCWSPLLKIFHPWSDLSCTLCPPAAAEMLNFLVCACERVLWLCWHQSIIFRVTFHFSLSSFLHGVCVRCCQRRDFLIKTFCENWFGPNFNSDLKLFSWWPGPRKERTEPG
jgi:hypothetical protein